MSTDATVVAAIAGAAGVAIGKLVDVFVPTRRERADRQNFERLIADRMLQHRLDAYSYIWTILAPFYKYNATLPQSQPEEDADSYRNLARTLRADLLAWYDRSGILFSRNAWICFDGLIKSCEHVIEDSPEGPDQSCSKWHLCEQWATSLRTALAEDIATRDAILTAPDRSSLEDKMNRIGLTHQPLLERSSSRRRKRRAQPPLSSLGSNL